MGGTGYSGMGLGRFGGFILEGWFAKFVLLSCLARCWQAASLQGCMYTNQQRSNLVA